MIEIKVTEQEDIINIFESVKLKIQEHLEFAEDNIERDPSTVLYKTRLISEMLMGAILEALAIEDSSLTDQFSKITYLRNIGFDISIIDKFDFIRRKGNKAVHEGNTDLDDPTKSLEYVKNILENVESITFDFYVTIFLPKYKKLQGIFMELDEIYEKVRNLKENWLKKEQKIKTLEFNLKRVKNDISFFNFTAKRHKAEIENEILKLRLANEKEKKDDINLFNSKEQFNFNIVGDYQNIGFIKNVLFNEEASTLDEAVEMLVLKLDEENRRVPQEELFKLNDQGFSSSLRELIYVYAADDLYDFQRRLKYFLEPPISFEEIMGTINKFCSEYNILLSDTDIERIENEILQEYGYTHLFSLKQRAYRYKSGV